MTIYEWEIYKMTDNDITEKQTVLNQIVELLEQAACCDVDRRDIAYKVSDHYNRKITDAKYPSKNDGLPQSHHRKR